MRKVLSRIVAAVAGVVCDAGCRLYALSDRLDGWDGTCEEPQQTFHVGPPTMTTTGAATFKYTVNDRYDPRNII